MTKNVYILKSYFTHCHYLSLISNDYQMLSNKTISYQKNKDITLYKNSLISAY